MYGTKPVTEWDETSPLSLIGRFLADLGKDDYSKGGLTLGGVAEKAGCMATFMYIGFDNLSRNGTKHVTP
jgi:hypothetical protein